MVVVTVVTVMVVVELVLVDVVVVAVVTVIVLVVIVVMVVVVVVILVVVVMNLKPSGQDSSSSGSVQKPYWLAMQSPDPTLQNRLTATLGVVLTSLPLPLALLPDPDDSVDGNEPSSSHLVNWSGHSLVVALTYPAHTLRAGW